MNKKGFTLIELLAVIVILAVIALIVTPIVTNIIAQAKESANARSVEGHVKNIEYAALEAAFKAGNGETNSIDGTYASQAALETALSAKGVSVPTNDHVTCTSYRIVEGTVMEADGCQESGWTKAYYFVQGSNAVVSPAQ